jgi:hypothetical protein
VQLPSYLGRSISASVFGQWQAKAKTGFGQSHAGTIGCGDNVRHTTTHKTWSQLLLRAPLSLSPHHFLSSSLSLPRPHPTCSSRSRGQPASAVHCPCLGPPSVHPINPTRPSLGCISAERPPTVRPNDTVGARRHRPIPYIDKYNAERVAASLARPPNSHNCRGHRSPQGPAPTDGQGSPPTPLPRNENARQTAPAVDGLGPCPRRHLPPPL